MKEAEMADDKTFVGGADRARVAGGEDYEVQAFAQRHGMTPQEVRDMIERIGNDRDALEREAVKLRRH
jgi:Protein of unknown function (DUF3606)